MGKRKAKKSEEETPKKKKKRHPFRKLLFLGMLGGGALAASQGLRDKVLDALFGAEEEFQYSPPTDAAAENGTPAGTA